MRRSGESPMLVFFETTKKCNLECRHCRMDRDEKQEIDSGVFIASLDGLTPKPMIILSGGEPLVRKDIFDLASALNAGGYRVSMATNGTLIDRETAVSIKKSGIARVAVSLDSCVEKIHDDIRGIPGSFSKALAGMECLAESGIPFQVNMTLTRMNRKETGDMVSLAIELGACAIHFFILVPVGCGMEIPPAERIRSLEMEETLEELFREYTVGGIPMRVTCAPQFSRLLSVKEMDHGIERAGGGCLAGRSIIFVASDGSVYPCGYFPLECGDVKKDRIIDIWKTSPLLSALRKPWQLEGRCGKCAYGEVCGGCRARAYAETGNVFGEDPACPYY